MSEVDVDEMTRGELIAFHEREIWHLRVITVALGVALVAVSVLLVWRSF